MTWRNRGRPSSSARRACGSSSSRGRDGRGAAGRSDGRLFLIRGNGDGTFAAASQYAWKHASFNAWAFSAVDVNGDDHLDIVWGSSANSPSTAPYQVNDGEVRVFYGNGDGTFVQNPYSISGVLQNAGSLLADIGSRAATVAAGDIDGDGDGDVVAGGIDGTDTVVKVIRNGGAESFSVEELIRMAISVATPATPIYFPGWTKGNFLKEGEVFSAPVP